MEENLWKEINFGESGMKTRRHTECIRVSIQPVSYTQANRCLSCEVVSRED